MNARLHLPNIQAPVTKGMAMKHKMIRMKTKNPFAHMSGSIAASQKRKLVKPPM